jgi:hypothetical protein
MMIPVTFIDSKKKEERRGVKTTVSSKVSQAATGYYNIIF